MEGEAPVNTRDRLEMIRADCKTDAARPMIDYLHEPSPAELRLAFGTRLGEVYAMIDALAASMLEILNRVDASELRDGP